MIGHYFENADIFPYLVETKNVLPCCPVLSNGIKSTTCNEIWRKTLLFSLKKIYLKMSSEKYLSSCSSYVFLNPPLFYVHDEVRDACCTYTVKNNHVNGLIQERQNSSALAMKLRLSCINPSISSRDLEFILNAMLCHRIVCPVLCGGTDLVLASVEELIFITVLWPWQASKHALPSWYMSLWHERWLLMKPLGAQTGIFWEN